MNSSNKNNRITIFLTGLFCGGGERVLLDIADFLAKDGFDVDLILVQKKGSFVENIKPGINIIDLNCKRLAYSIPKLAFYLFKNRPISILSTSEHAHVVSLLAKKISMVKTRVVLRIGIQFSIVFKKYKGKDKIIPYLVRWLYPKADVIIINSKGLAKDFIQTTHVSKSKTRVIYNLKSVEDIRKDANKKTRHKWMENENLKTILFTGRLRDQKDVATLIRAFSLVLKKCPSKLIILGDGEKKDNLISLTKELKIENEVDFHGMENNPFSFMSKATVFVLSSLWEGLPNVLIEAMICGVPIISTDSESGGAREILAPDTNYEIRMKDGIEFAEYGVLVPIKNEIKLAEAILYLLKDKNLRDEYKRKNLERIKDFDKNKILKEYKKHLI